MPGHDRPTSSTAPGPNSRPAGPPGDPLVRLQDLIRDRKRKLGRTWEQLSQRAVDAGHPISTSMLHHWAGNEWPNIPPTEALRGLAAALDLDVDEILAAAAASLDLRMREVQVDRRTRALIALVQERTPAQVVALERILHAVIDEMDSPGKPDP